MEEGRGEEGGEEVGGKEEVEEEEGREGIDGRHEREEERSGRRRKGFLKVSYVFVNSHTVFIYVSTNVNHSFIYLF